MLQSVLRAITKAYQSTVMIAALLTLMGGWIASQLWADDWHLPVWFWWGWVLLFVIVLVASVAVSDRLLTNNDDVTDARTEETMHWLRRLTGMMICLCLGAGWFTLASDHWDHHPAHILMPQQHASLTIELLAPGPMAHASAPTHADHAYYTQWVARVNRTPESLAALKGTHLLVSWPKGLTWNPSCQTGCQIQANGALTAFDTSVYRGGFDARRYYAAHHILASYRLDAAQVVTLNPSALDTTGLAFAQRLKDRVVMSFTHALPEPVNTILSGIVLGDSAAGVSREVKTAFADSGLIHLLAASGMNVGLIALLFLSIGRMFRWPLRLSLAVAMVGVLVYALMTGLPPSVQRAAMMLELAFALKWVRQQWQPLTLLCVSGALLMLLNPFVVTMLGFQLSFLSTLGLLAMTPPLQKRLAYYITSPVATLVTIPMVAQAWVTPLTVYTFHQLPLLAVLANVLALPLTALLTLLGFSLGTLAIVTYHTPLWGVALALIALCQWPLMALYALADTFAHWPGAVLTLPSPPWIWVWLCYAVLGWLTLQLRHALTGELISASLKPQHWNKLPLAKGFHFSQWVHTWRAWVKPVVWIGVVLTLPLAMATWAHQHEAWVAWLPLDSSYERYHSGALAQWVHDPTVGDTLSLTVPSGSLKPYQMNLIRQWLGHEGDVHVHRVVLDVPVSQLEHASKSVLGALITGLQPASVVIAKSQWQQLSPLAQHRWLAAADAHQYQWVWVEGAWQLSPKMDSTFDIVAYGRPGWTPGQGSLLYRMETKQHGCVLIGDWSPTLVRHQSPHCQLTMTHPKASYWLLTSLNIPPQSISTLVQHALTLTPAAQGQWRLTAR